jgi:hypothetical protein
LCNGEDQYGFNIYFFSDMGKGRSIKAQYTEEELSKAGVPYPRKNLWEEGK